MLAVSTAADLRVAAMPAVLFAAVLGSGKTSVFPGAV